MKPVLVWRFNRTWVMENWTCTSASVSACQGFFHFCGRCENRKAQYSLPLTALQVLGSLYFSLTSYHAWKKKRSKLPVIIFLVHSKYELLQTAGKDIKAIILSQVAFTASKKHAHRQLPGLSWHPVVSDLRIWTLASVCSSVGISLCLRDLPA